MGAQANAAPVIIKRKKVIQGGGHHGGAWKVAYADFVTAMMAFFMLMWLLNATTEQQRKGIADYFSPNIPINRVSGGGDGIFGGESILSQDIYPQSGTGGLPTNQTDTRGQANSTGQAEGDDRDAFTEVEDLLLGHGGESAVMENALKHIVTRVTDEGLVIELFDLEGARLFEPDTATPTQLLRDLASLVAQAAKVVSNHVAVEAHVPAQPIVRVEKPVWSLSANRADRMRILLEDAGLNEQRLERVTGHADREPALPDLMAARNNRVEIILLKSGKARR